MGLRSEAQILVVHNDPTYGGSGGTVGTVSIDSSAPQIAVHELGHSLFSLGDEYVAGWSTPEAYANCQYENCTYGRWAEEISRTIRLSPFNSSCKMTG